MAAVEIILPAAVSDPKLSRAKSPWSKPKPLQGRSEIISRHDETIFLAPRSQPETDACFGHPVNQRRVIVMWNIIIGLIFYSIILPTWHTGLKATRRRSGTARGTRAA